ncbi:PREDICTED: uncharacterized protein LOC104605017 [Nelumbo nucifera]|uniref:Uncharacterized protein n=2 Tax=Nelumbo nucifera TaxID=4432 RepID=A0A822YKM4_NELNU|nr:PREDICTED: uncharacterized protein LOC104605017 [Nelumbo nucifera]DAD33057.1 TPA_asm: hypothetical protein HUJ06_011908 [Nelumbo nucifera]
MSQITPDIRAKAEIHHGHEVCQERFKVFLGAAGLPTGLIPIKEAEECGYVEETGFVWFIQKKKTQHKFESIGKLVSFAAEVTAYVEPNRIKKLTGVKAKELLIWVTLAEMSLDDPSTGKIIFKTPSGLFRSYPVSAFEENEVKEIKEAREAKEANLSCSRC